MSAAWDLRYGGTTIARHEWKGLSKLNGRLEDWLEKQQHEDQESLTPRKSNRVRGTTMPGTYAIPDDEDDEDEDDEYFPDY